MSMLPDARITVRFRNTSHVARTIAVVFGARVDRELTIPASFTMVMTCSGDPLSVIHFRGDLEGVLVEQIGYRDFDLLTVPIMAEFLDGFRLPHYPLTASVRPPAPREMRTITVYRDDSTTPVVYERVKHIFWAANNTILVIAQYVGEGPEHRYIQWPRERLCWFSDVPANARTS